MPGRPRQIPLCTKLRRDVDECTLTIVGTDFYWSRTFELWSRRGGGLGLTLVSGHEALIGVSGKQAFGLMDLPRASACSAYGQRGAVYVKYKFARLLPADWPGYASLDLLVLYDADWATLTQHQQRAIAQWVSNGGRLLLVLGANPLPENHEITKLLPFRLGLPGQVRIPQRTLQDWGCRQYGSDRVTCWSLEAARFAPSWRVATAGAPVPLQAYGPVGFGKVGLCAFDPAAIGGRQDRSLAPFWVAQMAPLLDVRQVSHTFSPVSPQGGQEFRYGPVNRATNAVLEHLFSVEQLRPIHIGWVVLVLVALAVLIGPVDYVILRLLGRLPMTWVTATACIALFSVGAYYGVEYLRGGALQARVVSVLDGVEGHPQAWSTWYTGIFAPHSDDYRFTNLDLSQWWSGMAPTQDDEEDGRYGYRYRYRYSHDSTLGSQNIYCVQHIDGGNVPVSVPISIWSMQCLTCERPIEKMPFHAEVRRAAGPDEWLVTLQNAADSPITGSYVVVAGDQWIPLGAVPARQVGQFRGRPARWSPWRANVPHVREYDDQAAREATRLVNRTAFLARGASARTEGIRDYLRRGAMVVCAEYDGAPVPFDIAGRQCEFSHKQMARLVVFPKPRE
jgi:hypothetical protein